MQSRAYSEVGGGERCKKREKIRVKLPKRASREIRMRQRNSTQGAVSCQRQSVRRCPWIEWQFVVALITSSQLHQKAGGKTNECALQRRERAHATTMMTAERRKWAAKAPRSVINKQPLIMLPPPIKTSRFCGLNSVIDRAHLNAPHLINLGSSPAF